MEQLEKQDKTVRKLKKQLKVFAKKIGELEVSLSHINFVTERVRYLIFQVMAILSGTEDFN